MTKLCLAHGFKPLQHHGQQLVWRTLDLISGSFLVFSAVRASMLIVPQDFVLFVIIKPEKTGNQLIEAQAVCKQHYKLHTCLFYWAFSVGSCLVFVSLLNCCCIHLITWCSYVASLRKSGGFQHRSDIFLWYALCKCPVSPSLCVFCVSVLCLLSSSYLFFETVLSYLLG